MGADIGYINGGSLRADIAAGDVAFNHLLNVLPFNNTLVMAEISGQTLRDMMEMAMMVWPGENGAFPHLSGLTFSVNTSIPTSVELNEQEEFVRVAGQYRVYDMKVFDKETGEYKPLDLTKTYTLAASNYFLLEYGSGMTMLEDTVILQNDGMLDVEALERYVTEELDGVVGQAYAEATVNITFTEGEVVETETETEIETEIETETETEIETETETETETKTETKPTTPPAKTGGCGSAIGTGLTVMLLTGVLGGAALLRKRED
jgi:hypothetical protein